MKQKSLADKRIVKNIHIITTIVATILSIIGAFPHLKSLFHKNVHNMEITIPDIKANENVLTIPMIFKNNGDFDEILTNISLDFFDGDSQVLQLAETEDVFLFQKQSNYTKIFETEIDFQEKDKSVYGYILGGKTLSLELIYNFSAQENKHVLTHIKLGEVFINDDLTNFDMRILIPSKKIDYSNAKEEFVIENFPRSVEYDCPKLLERK